MKVGMIVAQGPGNGHRSRCDALRSGLLAAGHSIHSAWDDVDWIIVDDPFLNERLQDTLFGNLLAVDDGDSIDWVRPEPDLTIRPYAQPELAWVDADSSDFAKHTYINMGMSPQGRGVCVQVFDAFTELYKTIPRYSFSQPSVCLGAPGHSSWERCVAGMPTLQIVFSESQRAVGEAIESAGAGATVWNTLDEGEVRTDELRARIRQWLEPELLQAMADNARKLCDGKGVERTIKLMEEQV